jgi:hypothetical protein
MVEMTWFWVELSGCGDRLVETELDYDGFSKAVRGGDIIRPGRQVVALGGRAQDGRLSVTFRTLDETSPLLSGCKQDTGSLNLGHVVSFAEIDKTSEMWAAVKEMALGEAAILHPPKGIVVP